jgi:hypothetical protein
MIALQNMRMSCNSTYLLDQETDFGVKADELMTLLGDLYETPETKVVIFSQWVRTHEILQRRFAQRDYNHVLFHGGIPGTQRKGLVDRFREEDRCRAFLSTDAGGVGLNLQHASVVVNMDLPWNPAVLEQRIGRVHRLGQKRPVQVINFISQGTIEEGMLATLKFKKSLFTGALDGGEKEVFLGGSRLKRFMETVEQTSEGIPVQAPGDGENGTAETINGDGGASVASTGADRAAEAVSETQAQADPWGALLQTGLSFLQNLVAGSAREAPRTGDRPVAHPPANPFVRRDVESGQPYFHLPVPKPEVLDQLLTAAGEWLKKFRG